MCYRIMEKRSDAAIKSIDSSLTAGGKPEKAEAATARSQSEEKAYSRFAGQIQRWLEKDERKQEESVS